MKLPFGFSIETDFGGDEFLFLALLTLGILYIFLMNKPGRGSQTRLDSWLNWVIPLARSAALILLLMLLFAPQVSLKRQYTTPKRLAVIVDQSSSMGKAWEGSSEALPNSISNIIGVLGENYSVDVWSMEGQEIAPQNFIFDKNSSAFEWNPLMVNEQDEGDIYSAVFLLSDGHLNGGRSPLDLEWSKSLAVNVVYPLKPKSNRFLKLIDLSYAVSEENNDEILIQGKLHQEGLLGKQAGVQVLTELDQLLGEKNFQLNQSFQDIRLPIHILNDGKVKVKWFLKDGKFLTEQFLDIKIVKAKQKILIVSERVNELHKFLVQSFSDSSYQVHTIQGTKRVGVSTHGDNIPHDLDLVVLNSPGEQVLEEFSQFTFDLKSLSKTPTILFYDGNERLHSKWIEILGIRGVQANKSASPQTSFWSETSKGHAVYLGLLGRGYVPGDMMNYAPIFGPSFNLQTREVDLLISGLGATVESVLSLSDQPPQAIFSGSGFWRWFFHPQSKSSFTELWNYLLIYLEEIDSFTPVKIDIAVESAPTGSHITADVTIKDLDNRNIKVAELRTWQEDDRGAKVPLNLSRNQHGIYQTQIDTKHPGEILIIAEAYRFGELWGRDTSRIKLMSFYGEDQSRGVDEVFLSRLASRSGGQVIQFQEDDLPNIPLETITREDSYYFRGVRSPLLFAILLILLSFEWIWRRRSGLL